MSEWVKDNGIYYYYYSDGTMATGWQELDGYWYYFYSDGSMAYDTMVEGCYVNNDGQWTKDEGSKEIIDGNGDHFYYYIGPNNGKAVTGWNKIGDTFHYYNYPYGSMKRNDTQDGFDIDNYGNIVDGTGWIKDEYSGEWYYFSDGEMKTGWIQDGSNWYYLKADGTMATGWVEDDTGWYFLDDNGCMESNDTEGGYHLNSSGKMITGTGWKYVDSWWYYLDDTGKVVTGWLYDQGNWYYLYPQGSMAKDTTIDGYYLGDDGEWEPNDDGDSGDSQDTSDINDTLFSNIDALCSIADEYANDKTLTSNELVMMYIRQFNKDYRQPNWDIVAGKIDENFINYVRENDPNIEQYFSGDVNIIDPKSGERIELKHFAATLGGLLHNTSWEDGTSFMKELQSQFMPEEHLNNLCGWAGDLQTLMLDVKKKTNDSCDYDTVYNETKNTIGDNNYSFSTTDLLDDVDAVNINSLLGSSTSLGSALRDYYSSGVNTRYSDFVKNVAGSSDKLNFQVWVNYYTEGDYYGIGWPLLDGKYFSENQAYATRDAFTDYIWEKVQNE